MEPFRENKVCAQTVSIGVFNLVNNEDEGYGWILFLKMVQLANAGIVEWGGVQGCGTPADLIDFLVAILGKENDHRKEHSWRMFHK